MSIRPAVLLATAGLLGAGPMSALGAQGYSGQGDRRTSDVAFGLRAGTLGVGVEVSKLVASHLGLRVGGDFASLTLKDKEQTGIIYDVKIRWRAWSALIDLYPAARGAFHLTGGLITNPVKVTLTGKPSGDFFEINNNTYTAAEVGTLTGTGEFNSVLPYVGLGVGTAASTHRGLGFVFDLGAAIGKPTVNLTAPGAANNAQLRDDLNAQIASTQKDLDDVPVYPVLTFGLIYRF